MSSTTKRILREPAVVFVVLGALIFAIHGYLAAGDPDFDSSEIVISKDFITGLEHDHMRRTGAMPSPDERAHHVRELVRQEVLLREALALGLDRADLVIRRRLIQKMEFLLRDMASSSEPKEADLREYLADHGDAFRVPAKISFRQVFVANRGDWDGARARADELASRLRQSESDGPLPGDPFALGNDPSLAPVPKLEREIGPEVTRGLSKLPIGEWSEPMRSPYGWHIARVSQRTPAHVPPLAEIRERVARAWRMEREERARADYLAELMARYTVRIEEPEAQPTSGSDPMAARLP